MTDAGSQIKGYHGIAGTEPDADWYLVMQDGNEGTAANATISVQAQDLFKALFEAVTEKTVASGVLTVDQNSHKVQPQSGTTDDIDTISGMKANTTVYLWPSDAGTDTLTFKHGVDNLSCFGGVDIPLVDGFVICHYDGTTVFVNGGGVSGLGNIVEDTTPQLGGDLDLNGNNIDFPTTANISDCLDEGNMVSNSATKLATQQSIKTYADTKMADLSDDATPQLGGDLDLNGNNIDFPTTANISDCLDEDNMASDSATMLATQQSIKAYVDAEVTGKYTIFVPAGAMRPTVSNGCAALTDVETTAGRPDMQVLDFDATSDEHAQFQVAFPKSWNEGTVTFQVWWTSTATDTDGVAWGLQGVAVSDGDTIDVAYGTAIVVTDDAQSTAEDMYVTAESSAVTIAGTPAADDMCFFRFFRDVSDGNDDMTEDARLIGIKLFFTTDASDDT
jgi:hypothetical protein